MTVVAEEDTDVGLHSDGSFAAFYRAEYAAVVRLAYVLTGRRDVAEELAQDGFLAAHRRWGTISAYEEPAAWIRRVVTNRCISSSRQRVTELRLLARLGRERVAGIADRSGDEELWSLVRRLPRRQAQVVALSFLEDHSVRDIADMLGVGEESVRTHLRRGRASLASELRSEADHG